MDNSALPPGKKQRNRSPVKPLLIGIFCILLMAGTLLLVISWNVKPDPLFGVWMATDEYGGQHYYEFQPGGKMLYWDMDGPTLDSNPVKRGPFYGTHRWENRTIIATAVGVFGPRVGTLHWLNKNQLHQEFDGHIIRQNLTYTRVSEP